MNFSTIKTLLGLELRSLIRDRRTVILSIVLPIAIMPILLFTSSTLEKRRQERLRERPIVITLTGDRLDVIRTAIADGIPKHEPAESAGDAGSSTPPRFEERGVADPDRALMESEIDIWLEGVTGDGVEAVARDELTATRPPAARTDAPPNDTVLDYLPEAGVIVHYRSDRSGSQAAATTTRRVLEAGRLARRDLALAERGLPDSAKIGSGTYSSISSERQAAGLRVSRFLSLLVVFFLTVGGATVASDLIAGEKERGTLETLLTTAASRRDIVMAKLLAVLGIGMLIVTLEFLSVIAYAQLRLVDIPRDYIDIVTVRTALTLLVLYLPVAAFIAGVLLLASGAAKSYKEAQLYLFPMQLVFAVLCAAPMLPGLSLRSAMAVVPVANISIAVKEILTGRIDLPMLAVAWLSMAAAATLVAWRATRLLSSENFVSGGATSDAEVMGGSALFSQRVMRWFAMMWVAVFLASSYLPTADIRLQVAVNLIVVFFGASMVMIRMYKLDPATVLALRKPKPMVWLAVLVGAPSGLLVGLGVAQLAGLVVPVPTRALEEFSRAFSAVDIPLWQMLLFVAVLPGICEEIAFRGMLLHGLRRRYHPVVLCLVVGAIFGLFHFSLFRLASTAFLGVVLSAVVLLTGSVFPAMLWHTLNNAMAIAGSSIFGEAFAPATWMQVAAIGPLALSIWILWKNRSGYPGLRSRAPKERTEK